MTKPERTVEEIAGDFTQYCDDGYNGGKDGLRCTDCDRKYRGQAQIEQLCPVCNVRKTLTAERQKRQEMVEAVKKETIKEMNDLFIKWLQDNIGNLATEALNKAITQPNNPK